MNEVHSGECLYQVLVFQDRDVDNPSDGGFYWDTDIAVNEQEAELLKTVVIPHLNRWPGSLYAGGCMFRLRKLQKSDDIGLFIQERIVDLIGESKDEGEDE